MVMSPRYVFLDSEKWWKSQVKQHATSHQRIEQDRKPFLPSVPSQHIYQTAKRHYLGPLSCVLDTFWLHRFFSPQSRAAYYSSEYVHITSHLHVFLTVVIKCSGVLSGKVQHFETHWCRQICAANYSKQREAKIRLTCQQGESYASDVYNIFVDDDWPRSFVSWNFLGWLWWMSYNQ